jgi:hypothetical protein
MSTDDLGEQIGHALGLYVLALLGDFLNTLTPTILLMDRWRFLIK